LIKTKIIRQFTLHKSERVKKRKVIEQLFSVGKSFSIYPLRVYYLLNDKEAETPAPPESLPDATLQAGVGVSKRHFKKAVHRNRIKRLLRETYRLQKLPLQLMIQQRKTLRLQVFFIFTGKELPLFNELKATMAAALIRLEKEVTKKR
jgi:ribonuclease P protein component